MIRNPLSREPVAQGCTKFWPVATQVGGPEHIKEVIGTAKASRDSPHLGHGDVSLAQEGDWHMIVCKGKVENGNRDSIGKGTSDMADIRVELAEIDLPDFGHPTVEPRIEGPEHEARLRTLWKRATGRGLDVLLVYGDREHSANMAFLTGFDPRFEEALLILNGEAPPIVLVGNEGWGSSQISPIKLDRRLYQPFSLMGQDRSKTKSLATIMGDLRVGQGTRVGITDWKYFGPEAGQAPELWLNAPAYLVDTLRQVTGQSPVNVTDLLMNPRDGLRAINSVDQLASFEFAATHISNGMRRVIWSLRPGLSEFEAIEQARLNGMPLSCHPMLAAGPRAAWMASPSSRRMQRGEPFICGMGVWGALCARAGFLVCEGSELPGEIRDYVKRLVKPYFAAVVEWYQHIGLGVQGGELYEIIHRRLDDPFFGVSLNPGHLIHLDEWLHCSTSTCSHNHTPIEQVRWQVSCKIGKR